MPAPFLGQAVFLIVLKVSPKPSKEILYNLSDGLKCDFNFVRTCAFKRFQVCS